MHERSEGRRLISRRKFLFGSATLAGGAILGADYKLKDGIMLDPPPLDPKPKTVNLEPYKNPLISEQEVVANRAGEPIFVNDQAFAYYNSEGDLIFQHENARFDPNREYNFSHRSGNSKDSIDKAVEKGANGFDIDANDIGGGRILAEHGIIRNLKAGKIDVGFVIDIDQKEVVTRLPDSVVEIFDYVGRINDSEDPYVVQVELKRGSFDDERALMDMIKAISRNNIPTRIFSRNQRNVDNVYFSINHYAEDFSEA